MSSEEGYTPESDPIDSLSAVIIGGTTLAVHCAERWLRSGHLIFAVFATDEVFRDWARDLGILCLDDLESLAEYSKAHHVEYLFSIVNPQILSPRLLNSVLGHCFNYHDGPLPRYAGQNATGWALLNREQDYAISWHLLEVAVDQGNIAVSIPISITSNETAFSLNLKCYRAARSGFDQLVHVLESKSFTTGTAQDLSHRSFNPGYRRPVAGGVLLWNRPAAELSAVVRALNYGEYYPALLDSPKILLSDGSLVRVADLEVLPTISNQVCGTVLSVEDDALVVATADFDVRVAGFNALGAARAIAVDTVLETGQALELLDSSQQQALTTLHEDAARSERFWYERLARFSPLSLTLYPWHVVDGADSSPWLHTHWQTWFEAMPASADEHDSLLLAFMLMLSRLTGSSQLQLGWARPSQGALYDTLLNDSVPLHFAFDEQKPVIESAEALAGELHQVTGLPGYVRTLCQRYPALRSDERLGAEPLWPIMIARGSQCPVAQQLTLHIDPERNAFRLGYNAQTLAEADVQRLLGYLHTLGAQLSQGAAQRRCGDLIMLPAHEQEYLVHELNPPRKYPDPHYSLLARVRYFAQVAPQATALVFETEQLSYQQYDQSATQWAGYLAALGVKTGDVIAVCAQKSPASFIAFLATLRLGAIYLPLDPSYPAARLEHILKDSAPRLLLADADGQDTLSVVLPEDLALVRLDQPMPTQLLNERSVLSDPDSQQTAYIIYTSGSTGAPKGVRVSHANLGSLIQEQGLLLGVSRESRILQFSSLSFDASIWEIAMAHGHGGALYIPTQIQRLEEHALLEFFRHHSITHATLPPALLSRSPLLTQGMGGVVLTLAGEASAIELFHQLSQRNTVINGYGPTEGTVCNIAWLCPNNYKGELSPIGHALGNSQVYVLDAWQRLVPFGAIGELYIGGEGVAQGYLNRPQLTAERFIMDPFQPGPARQLYRTGDLVRYLPDASLLFLGRVDHQIKIRGFRIELGEIEAVLKQVAGVSECTVIARDSQGHGPQLIAYLVNATDRLLEASELRTLLEKKLPSFMVPAAFVVLAHMPLNVNGKIDRKALPLPASDDFSRQNYEPVEGEREQLLASLWSEFFQVDRLGRKDNFFALGGDSLLAIKLVGRLNELGWQVKVEHLFKAPQLQAFAGHLQLTQRHSVSKAEIVRGTTKITPHMLPLLKVDQATIDSICRQVGDDIQNIQDIYPLSPLQEGLYFHNAMAEQGDPYLLVTILALPDRATLERYLAALQQVLERHDILRTAIVGRGLEQPVQVVMREVGLPITWLNLQASEGDIHDQLCELYEPSRLAMPLDKAPLLQVVAAEDRLNNRWLLLHRLHHLVGDHTTLEVIYRELNTLMKGRGDTLSPALAFRDLIERTIQADEQQSQLAFFSTLLGDVDEPCLPYGQGPIQDARSSIKELKQPLSALLNQRLRRQAREYQVSLASIFHVAWGRVLALIGSQSKVVFGSVFFGRSYGDGSSQALGMFINTLPVRVDIDARSVASALQEMHLQLTALLGYEHASLINAQQASGIAPPTPLFSALLNYRHNSNATLYSQPLADFPEITLVDFNETTSYPLVLSVEDYGHQTQLTLQAVDGIDGEQVLAYVRQVLESLLDALEQEPKASLQQLRVLPESEFKTLVHERNLPWPEQGCELCVHQQFERRAALQPDTVALVFAGQVLTYGQLNQQSNQLAHGLIERGVQPDTAVALCAVPGFEMMIALLGILKAGAAYLPIDPGYAVERIRLILDDAQPMLMLCDTSGREALWQQGYENLLLLSDVQVNTVFAQHNPHNRVTPQQLAYIIYTSGSTGTPKGVMVEHRQVSRLFSSVQPWFGFDAQDVWCLFHSFAFDFSVWEIWGALLHGGKLLLLPSQVTRDARTFYQIVSKERVTVLNQTPSAFRSFINEQLLRPVELKLRYVVFGGEALDTSMLAPWFDALGDQQPQLINMYGITETTVHVTYRPLTAQDCLFSQSPVGKRIPDLRLYLLDPQQSPVPDGVTGELYVAGAGLTRGYLNRPELTAQRFVQDPFSSNPQERMYRTGDLAYYRADGELVFAGRNDQQVKLRGFRIELGEIEAALNLQPSVAQSTVILREDDPGEPRLVAYVVAHETGQDPTPVIQQLRQTLLTKLPEYMVPAAFVFLDTLPLTGHGKLDRRMLPVPQGQDFTRETYQAPQGDAETLLTQIWSQLLDVDPISRYDNFFALGGHSLRAIQLIERLHSHGWQADIRQIFRQPQLAEFSKTLSKIQLLSDNRPPAGIAPGSTRITPDLLPLTQLDQAAIDLICAATKGGAENVQDIYPLSPLQDGMLFHHLLHTEGDPYLLVSQLAFERRETLQGFLDALQQVVVRHDSLRTAIISQVSPALQVVWREAPLQIEELELSPGDGPVSEQLSRRFDPRHLRLALDQPPLLRLVIAHDVEQQRWVMLLLMHHLIGDHATLDLMMQEVASIMSGKGNELKPAVPYRQLIASLMDSDREAEHERFFRRMLADIQTPSLAFAINDVKGGGEDVEEYHQPLSADLNQYLRDAARQAGVSLASLCHLAWARVLASVSGQSKAVFGTVLFGRLTAIDDTSRGMGLFINTLPLRVDIDQRTVLEGVKDTHTALAELLEHEHASLALAQRCSAVEAPVPLFNSLLNYRHSDSRSSVFNTNTDFIPGVKWLEAVERTNYPIAMAVEDFNESLALTAQVKSPINAKALCSYMETVLTAIAQALVSHSGLKLGQLAVVAPSAQRSVAVAAPSSLSIVERFEQQAASHPESIALRSPQGELNYGQLNRKANQLAHFLRQMGVQPDDRVAICVDRRLSMVVGLLAILKAGGAYVPLDVAYPLERLVYVLDDAKPLLLLEDARANAVLARAEGLPNLLRVRLDGPDPAWSNMPEGNPVCAVTHDNLAYMIYTSGSTGRPKGVRVLHRGLSNHTDWQCSAFALSASDHVLQRTSISFDASVWELWTPLTLGASLYILPNEEMRDLSGLIDLLITERITVLQAVPSMLVDLPEVERLRDGALRYLFCGGEPLAGTLVNRWLALVSEAVVNLYGPTETTIDATFHTITEPVSDGFQPIGKAIDNTRLYVLDEHRQEVPVGAVGELYIGGVGVSQGYHQNPELTAERFISDDFGQGPDILFRSGDLVRQSADGDLLFMGRGDDQVKVRGYRIEPGEVEQCLQSLPQVREALVAVRNSKAGPQLVAYVVLQTPLELAQLRSELLAQVPEYMVPGFFVELEQLPRLPNGKLNRRDLPAPNGRALAAESFAAPQGELEEALAEIWSQLLGGVEAGRHDNFFALGGHSLLVLKLRNAIQQTFGVNIALSHLFDYGELASMANHILLLIVVHSEADGELSEQA